MAANYCRTNLGHGGVSIYVKNGFAYDYESINVDQFCIEKVFEVALIAFNALKLIVITVYRTPDSDIELFNDTLNDLILYVQKLKKFKNFNLVISGDLNIDIRFINCKTKVFLNLLRSLNLYCLNKSPTRLNACLDNIITHSLSNEYSCEVIQPHLSDHMGLKLDIKLKYNSCKNKIEVKETVIFRPINKFSVSRFVSRLSELDWFGELGKFVSVEQAFQYFLETIASTFNQYCPEKTRKKSHPRVHKPGKSWYTPELEKLKSLLLYSFDMAKLNPAYKDTYARIRKIYRYKVRLARIRANDDFIMNSANKCKAAWKIINSELGERERHNNFPFSPNEFNDYFVNVCNNIVPNIVNSTNMTVDEILEKSGVNIVNNFKWKSVSLLDVDSSIQKLSSSKSEDFYGLSNYILKQCRNILVYPLAYLINWMFLEGVYPTCLKITITVPVFKKGDINSQSNYRPISLVPIVSKVVESIMKEQLDDYFRINGILSSSQYGFQKGLSTINAVEDVMNYVLKGFEDKHYVHATMLDLSKAFDVVSHDILVQKLEFYGIVNDELNLFRSYLTDRYQLVKIGYQRSSLLKVMNGVPQGSVLGPFLFIIFINDLPRFLSSKCVLYADDTTLLTSGKNLNVVREVSEAVLKMSCTWFESNKLILNNNKTEEIIFSIKTSDHMTVKLLGIYLDSKLSWYEHTFHLCKKLARVNFLLRKLKLCTSKDLVLNAYFSFFHCHLLYGNLLWGNSPAAQQVFIWQKKAVRCIVGINNTDSCRPHFINLGILTLPCVFMFQSLLYIKEHYTVFNLRSSKHTYNTRNKHFIDDQFVRLCKTKNSFVHVGINLFNKLPLSVQLMSVNSFKLVIKKWLLKNAFYSLGEFCNVPMDDSTFMF